MSYTISKAKATVIKTVQLSHTITYHGRTQTVNKIFRTALPAAKHWASYAASAWQERTGAPMDAQFEREERYIRKSLPVFKAMLAS